MKALLSAVFIFIFTVHPLLWAQGIAMFEAIKKNDQKMAQHLLLAGDNPNTKDPQGMTPLMYATLMNNPRMVELLLRNGSDDLLKTKGGETAMDFAVKNKYEKIIFLLRLHRQNIQNKTQARK